MTTHTLTARFITRLRTRRARCIWHWHSLTPEQQHQLLAHYPHNPRAQARLLLDRLHHMDRMVTSTGDLRLLVAELCLHPWAVRWLARGWVLPIGWDRRTRLRAHTLRLVCQGCRDTRELWLARQEAWAEAAHARQVRREARRAAKG
ncbi:hypothetical protein ACWCXX_37610 [Streptomyces sp. NPDC001732]